ncbi:MAG: hypothetical protein NXI20_20675 [bacterium]|nr:hypothetical protein [bacterium]
MNTYSYSLRFICDIDPPDGDIVRLMIFQSHEGTYLFGYNSKQDSSAIWDLHFNDIEDAFESATDYGVVKSQWTEIPDPLPNCQHDWINPIRVKGRNLGSPQWGKLEKLINGEWIDI